MNEVEIVAFSQGENDCQIIHINEIGTANTESKVTGTISQEINSIHSMEFTIYPSHPAFEMLFPYKTRLLAGYDDNYPDFDVATDFVFFGRVLKITPNMTSAGELYKNVLCENYLGFLCDSTTELKMYTGTPSDIINDLFENHYSQIKKDVFKLGECDASEKVELEGEGESTYDFLINKLIPSADGEIKTEDIRIDDDGNAQITVSLTHDGNEISDNRIKIGENLISYNQEEDVTNMCTRVIPVGAKIYTDEDNLERVTISSVNNGKKYIETPSEYGIIAKTVLYQNIEEPAELKAEGEKYLQENKNPSTAYQMTAFDNHNLDRSVERMKIGGWYYVDVPILGVKNVLLRITKKTICIENPANDTFTVGATKTGTSAAAEAVTATDVSKIYDTINISDTVNTHRLNAVEGNIRKLYTEDLTAINADIFKLKTREAQISTIIFGTAEGEYISVDFSDAVVSQISDGIITNAMIQSLAADKITAGRISTNLVDIGSDDGMLTLKDETLQIYDGQHVRVQIGKDRNGDYNLVLWDANGNLLWDAAGIGEAGIRDDLIVDRMVSENASINGKKIDLPSLIKEINDGKEVIKSNHIVYDSTGQTLDIAFNRVESKLLDDRGWNLYQDSQNMEDGWVCRGEWTWGSFEGFRYGISSEYGYLDCIFPLTEGVSYTLSAWVKGDIVVYYPTAIVEGGRMGKFEDWTRVSYAFTYSEELGKPVFSSQNEYYIYGIKLEYGGACTEWCLTAEEQNRESLMQITALQVANGNIDFLLYKRDGLVERMSSFEMAVGNIELSVKEINENYVKRAQLQVELEAISSTVEGVDGRYTELKQTVDSFDIAGLVRFDDLKQSGRTEIDGGNIVTGTISADKIDASILTTDSMKTMDIEFYNFHSTTEDIQINGVSGIIYVGTSAMTKTGIGAETVYCNALASEGGSSYLDVKNIVRINNHGMVSDGPLIPSVNGGASIGQSSHRWSEIYAQKSAINTSDRRYKKNIEPISQKYENLWFQLKPVSFMFNNGDRIHWGMISQDIETAMDEIGLADTDVAMFCKDIKEVLDENTGEWCQVFKSDGTPEYIYSLRYGELISLNTHMLQKAYEKLDAQEKRIEILEQTVEKLLQQVNSLTNQ